jgi:ABC-type protease/lipase transport system fused ATPase/permease subunit
VIRSRTNSPSDAPNALTDALRACRTSFVVVGLFSLVINAMMLAMPIYMLQVYDRVLTTGRIETLIMLSVMAATALVIMGAMDALRSAIMVRLGAG